MAYLSTNDDQEGARRKALGMRLASDSQDAEDPEWAGDALSAVEKTAHMYEYFDPDNVRETGIREPHDPHAWGSVYQKARKIGLIEDAYDRPPRKSIRPIMHAGRLQRYHSLVWDGF